MSKNFSADAEALARQARLDAAKQQSVVAKPTKDRSIGDRFSSLFHQRKIPLTQP